jgi:hypothetical protein
LFSIREEEEEEEEEVSVSRGKKRNKTFRKNGKKENETRNLFTTLKHKNSGYKYAKTHTSSVLR